MNKKHWNNIYSSKAVDAVSWYQPVPVVSLDLINSINLEKASPIIDIGRGASNLVDHPGNQQAFVYCLLKKTSKRLP
jgi:hypothetical protein